MKVEIGFGGWGIDAPRFTLKAESQTDDEILGAFDKKWSARDCVVVVSTAATIGADRLRDRSTVIALAPLPKKEKKRRKRLREKQALENEISRLKYILSQVEAALEHPRRLEDDE